MKRKIIKSKGTGILALFLGLVIISIFAMTEGSVKIPLGDVFKVSFNQIGFNFDISDVKPSYRFIISDVRMPRIILAALVGGLLSVIGTAFQAIFKNPMADPYIMGVSSGAAFGATLGIVFGIGATFLGLGLVSFMAFIGAFSTVLIVYNLSRIGNSISTTSILLAGIVMNSLLSSIVSLIMILNHNDISKIITWTMGSFNAASWESVKLMILPTLIGGVILIYYSRDLNAIIVGEEEAINLGVNVEWVKKIILVLSSFLAAFAVSVSGIIGFVGLIIPHLLRMFFGSDHRTLIPASFFGGSVFLVICDTIARSIIPNMEIPVGIITSIFGGPFFLYLLNKNKRKQH